MSKFTVFIDMDGVLADFDAAITPSSEKGYDPPEMFVKGFFRNLKPLPGAKRAIKKLLKRETLDLYIASKPSTKNLWSTIEKYEWIEEHFPELLTRMFLACNKHFLRGHVLIDDDKDRWGLFPGMFIHFDRRNPAKSWRRIVKLLSW